MKLFILAVESSADHIGAGLVKEMRALNPDVQYCGIGGHAMQAEGVPSQMDISGLAILGFLEALLSARHVLAKVKEATERVMESDADAVILIDSWGFMVRVAKRLKMQGWRGKIIKYLAPQVWAMRAGRGKVLAQYADHLLTIHSFDAPYFEPYGLPTHYVGNPIFDIDYGVGDAEALRREYNLGDRPVLAVFFGSRPSEIARMTPPFTDAVMILREQFPDLALISPVSDAVADQVASAAGADMRMNEIILLPESRKMDVMACATAALACSGTMTTQLACVGLPSVVAYKVAGLTWVIFKWLYQQDYVSIVNIAAGAELMPEFLQDAAQGQALADMVAPLLADEKKRAAQSDALLAQIAKMRGDGRKANVRAAQALLDILS